MEVYSYVRPFIIVIPGSTASYAIAHLPESMKSPDLYMSLVRENPQNLKGVPRIPIDVPDKGDYRFHLDADNDDSQ